MLIDIFSSIKTDVVMSIYFSIIMVFGMSANTIMGVIMAKQVYDNFKFSILVKGVLRNLGIILATALAATSLSGIVAGIQYFNIDIVNPEMLNNISVIVIVGTLIGLTVTIYGKQFIDKLKSLGGLKKEDEVVNESEEPNESTEEDKTI